MLLTVPHNYCSLMLPPSTRKRGPPQDSRSSISKKRAKETPVAPVTASNDHAPISQHLHDLATAAASSHRQAPRHAKRHKGDVTLPNLTAIAQLQAPDNWHWSSTDKSHATEIRAIGSEFMSVKFHPFWSNFGTAGIRATKPINGGVHYWQILIPGRVYGTSMMVGIGTQNARVHADGFVHLLGGLDDESWGLCHNGSIYHNGRFTRYTSPFPADEPTVIGVLYDGTNDELTFYRNGRCLGVAFSNILTTQHAQNPHEPRCLFPMLSSTSAQTEMVLCCQLRNYNSLQDRCRSIIAHSLGYSIQKANELDLPDQLKQFISREICS